MAERVAQHRAPGIRRHGMSAFRGSFWGSLGTDPRRRSEGRSGRHRRPRLLGPPDRFRTSAQACRDGRPRARGVAAWRGFARRWGTLVLVTLAVVGCGSIAAAAAGSANRGASLPLSNGLGGPREWTSPEGLSSALQIMLTMTVISLAPAILMMTTSFIRIVVVLGLLRQAIGTQQLPPSQVITSIALFMTLLLMAPVWKESYEQGIRPYTQREITLDEAWDASIEPIRRFMADQIVRTENDEDVYLFLRYLPNEIDPATGQSPDYQYYGATGDQRNVPLAALVPAFMLSELKTAFLIGFQIYLPFVILDIVVASVTISMGMLMLPPVLISLPFKLLLFVLVDGWHLVVEMLLESFQIM